MDRIAVGESGEHRNPFGSFEAYGCREPRHNEAARMRRRSRVLLLVAYAFMAFGFLAMPARVALLLASPAQDSDSL